MEAEASSHDESQALIQCLNPSIGESGAEGVLDSLEVSTHSTSEADEGGQATALSPGEPALEHPDTCLGWKAEDLAELLLEQVGAVKGLVLLGDVREPRRLVVGQVLGVLQE